MPLTDKVKALKIVKNPKWKKPKHNYCKNDHLKYKYNMKINIAFTIIYILL